MRWPFYMLLAVALTACASASGGSATYNPYRCDRTGDEWQRKAC